MITLATLPQATAQEVFDQVATHLLTQMRKSEGASEPGGALWCLYRGPNGTKCAAGCLMSDEEYHNLIDHGVEWIVLVYAGAVPNHHRTLISRLQQVHDCYPPNQWHEKLEYYASDFSLNTNVLEQFNG